MDAVLALMVAALGSSVITTLITLAAGRFRFDRQAGQLSAWKSEAEMVDELELRAGRPSDGDTWSTNLALSALARAQLNYRLTFRIVPSSAVRDSLMIACGIALGIAGLAGTPAILLALVVGGGLDAGI